MGIPSGAEWIWIIIAIAVIFGASRLPLLGRNLGQGIKEFKKGIKEVKDDTGDKQVEGGKADGKAGGEGAAAGQPSSSPERLAERRD